MGAEGTCMPGWKKSRHFLGCVMGRGGQNLGVQEGGGLEVE